MSSTDSGAEEVDENEEERNYLAYNVLQEARTNIMDFSKKLVCVTFPAVVKNVDKAMNAIGGITSLECAVMNPKKNLELRFRPDDLFSKPAISERNNKPCLLLRLKISNPGRKRDPQVYAYEVVGVTAVNYTFPRLIDFQYLSLVTDDKEEKSTSPLENIYRKIVPVGLPRLSWLKSEEAAHDKLFLPPALFTKNDLPNNSLHFERSQFYEGHFTADYSAKIREAENRRRVLKQNKEGTRRATIFCGFYDDIPMEVPVEIRDEVNEKMTITLANCIKILKDLFEERPVWSRVALRHRSDLGQDMLKQLLPYVAFYYSTGPWRVMWVKYGYDPRLDARSRIYQTFDFRIRARCGLKTRVSSKRNYVQLRMPESTSEDNNRDTLRQQVEKLLNLPQEESSRNNIDESHYILRPNVLPVARQMFYQYCDVQIQEVQTMIARLPTILPVKDISQSKCDPKLGWFPRGFHDQCRDVVSTYMFKLIHQTANTQSLDAEITENTLEISDSSDCSSDEDSLESENNHSDMELGQEVMGELNASIQTDSLQ